jgi:uncharacterized protein YcgI (DUF1989 family)
MADSSSLIRDSYQTVIDGGKHWSLNLSAGTLLRLTDIEGGANVGMLFYNPQNPLERYNAPDTLKCQHTFKLTKGHCLYSDMGRIFCSIVEDSNGWHDTVCGNSTQKVVASRWGEKSYQVHRNEWTQNGHDAFLVEAASTAWDAVILRPTSTGSARRPWSMTVRSASMPPMRSRAPSWNCASRWTPWCSCTPVRIP